MRNDEQASVASEIVVPAATGTASHVMACELHEAFTVAAGDGAEADCVRGFAD